MSFDILPGGFEFSSPETEPFKFKANAGSTQYILIENGTISMPTQAQGDEIYASIEKTRSLVPSASKTGSSLIRK